MITLNLFGKSENFFAALRTLRFRVKINECTCAFGVKRKAAKFAKMQRFLALIIFQKILLLKEKKRLNETIFMAALTLFCFVFSVLRFVYTDTKMFLFLNWNLFLASVSWILTTLLILKPRLSQSKFCLFALMGVWLLFFPNAPYILTDLFHLRLKLAMPVWFDLVLVLSFAWAGLLFGFLSLWDIEQFLSRFIKTKHITIFSVTFLFLGSFGIYIGRYLRWNSWDIISQPFALMYDIGDRIINPFSHPGTWGMTIFMGIFLNILYWSFRLIRNRK